MKKFLLAYLLVGVCCLNVFSDDGFALGVWFDSSKQNIEGIGFGLPVIKNQTTEGASLALCGNEVQKMDGFQLALLGFNYSRSFEGVQIALINMLRKQHGEFAMQWGFYNQSAENGIQIGVLNNARNNASFQLGFININKNGWLPVMLFVNFGKDFFK